MRVNKRLGLALMAGVPASTAIVYPFGPSTAYPKRIGPLWLAAAALAIALRLISRIRRRTLDGGV